MSTRIKIDGEPPYAGEASITEFPATRAEWISDNSDLEGLLNTACPIPQGYFPTEHDLHLAALKQVKTIFPEAKIISTIPKSETEDYPADAIF